MSPDLDALLGGRPRNGGGQFSPEVAAARKAEQCRRHAAARGLAKQALAVMHPDDFQMLLNQAKERVWTERGPLPGD
jgi:hypothetical protein